MRFRRRNRAVVSVSLFAKRLVVGVTHFLGREGVGNLYNDLPRAMRAEALLASVFVFDFESVPIRALDADAHGRSLRNGDAKKRSRLL